MSPSIAIRKMIVSRFWPALLIALVVSFPASAQVSISGTTCANSGTQYTYTIAGNWNSSTFMSWSITGAGTFSGSSSGTPCPQVHVTWTGSGTLHVTCSNPSGSASLSVSISSSVTGGTVSPSSQTINYNTTPGSISCTASMGGSCSPSYSYQWQSSVDNVNYSNIASGGTGQNYSPGQLTQTTYFRRFVTETVGGTTAYSTVSTVLVNPPLNGGTLGPASQQIFTGGSPTQIGGAPGSGGACTTYNYQWQSSTDGVNFTNASGTGQNFTPPTVAGLVYYRRQTTCTSPQGFETANSTVATVDIENHLATGTLSPSTITINAGTSPGQITGTASTGGFCSGYTYIWYSSPDGSTWTAVSGATGVSYTPGNLSLNTYYERETDCGSEKVWSNTIEVVVQTQSGSATPASQQINYGTNGATLTVSGMAGGTGTYSYQWQSSPDNTFSSPTNVGTNATTYTPTALTATTYYRVQVSSGGTSAYSASVVVNVYPQLVAGSISPSSQAIITNTTPATMTLSGVSGGNGTYFYQWYSNATGSYLAISGATGTSYTPGALPSTTSYYVSVTSNGVTMNTATVTISVYPTLVSGAISPASQTIDYNTTASSLTLSGTTGGNGSYTYQWYSNTGGGYQAINGATGATYSPGSMAFTTSFEVVVTSIGVNATSAPATITVYPQLVAGTLTPGYATITSGISPGMLTCNPAMGGRGTYSYQWQSSPDGNTWTNISGATGLTYNPGNPAATIYYQVVVSSGNITANSNTGEIVVGSVSSDWNYVRTRNISKPGVTDTVTANGLSSTWDVQQTTQYFDGLGRPIQAVAKQASPLGKDMVSIEAYDAFGREMTKYLPFTSPSSDGNFKTDPFGEQNSFNATQFPNDQFYYGQVNFDPSPLTRPMEAFAAGNSWVGSDRGISLQYTFNTAADSVQVWNIAMSPGSFPTDSGAYTAGRLYKKVSTDEQRRLIVEYKDLLGHIILRKVQVAGAPATGHAGWVCTYYVYDVLNNLRFVVQPAAVQWLQANGWNFLAAGGTGVAAEFCFRHEYDQRKRMIIRKVPGAGEVWMIYDARDRLVLSEDSNLRSQQKWLFTKFDALNRPIVTGFYTDGTHASQSSMQAYLNSSNMALFETFNSANNPEYSLNQSFPVVNSSSVLTYTYYDSYSYNTLYGSGNKDNSFDGFFASSYSTVPYPQPLTQWATPAGLVTGVWDATGPGLLTALFYDDHDRVIQTKQYNITGGWDIVTKQYDFCGRPLQSYLRHQKMTNTAQTHSVNSRYNYDPIGRMRSVYKNLDNASADQLIDSIQYNELGQLSAKYLGKTPSTGEPLDSLVYSYNIRSWLTGINKNYLGGTTTNYFGMELAYDNPSSITGTTYLQSDYNGNIAGTIWKSAGDGVDRKYDFSYDNLNRLTAAAYLDNKNGSGWNTGSMDFSVNNLSYDANGNILSMNQRGFKIGNPTALIDSLTYSYQFNGSVYTNKLSQVNDAMNDTASLLGDFHYKGTKQSSDYAYDGNGNLVVDNNKNIDYIAYNYLDLPQQVHLKGKGSTFYTYNASGNEIQKQTIDSVSGIATTTLYLSGFQYQRRAPIANPSSGNDTLQMVGHEEGRARWAFHKHVAGDTVYAWEYDFVEKDHLGNTRVMLTQEKDTAQYLASMEAAYRSTENALFYNIPATSYARSNVSGYPVDHTFTNPNDSVARINGSGPKEGPAIILKVMAGDKVDLGVQYYYNSMTNTNGPNLSPSDLLNSLASGLVAITGTTHGTFSTLDNTSTSPLLGALTSSIGNETGAGTTKPQAYVNWVLLDNQFNYVSGSSGALQVAAAGTQSNGTLQPPLAMTGIPMTKSGFLYIYVSNATPGWDVFFDNLSVRTYAGPMLEENHYYPFGLTMAGISDMAVKTQYAQNKYRYNGKELQNQEFSDGSSLELYDFSARMQDPQLGRFHMIDPHAERYNNSSPYAFVLNNPILSNDPTGQDAHLEGLAAQMFLRELQNAQLSVDQMEIIADDISEEVEGHLPDKPGALYTSPDAAAFGWGRLYGATANGQNNELSSAIYSIKVGNQTFYSFTAFETADVDKDPQSTSPGIEHFQNESNLIPKGGKIIGDIHSHGKYDENHPENLTFSRYGAGRVAYFYDEDLMAKYPQYIYYLYNAAGNIIARKNDDPANTDPSRQFGNSNELIATGMPWDQKAKEKGKLKFGPYTGPPKLGPDFINISNGSIYPVDPKTFKP